MKFEKHVSREMRDLLSSQLKDYERETSMTTEERRQLHEWVASGHSPYDNGDYIYSACVPVDFLSALRTSQELQEWFDSLTDDEKREEIQANYLHYDSFFDDICFATDRIILPSGFEEELPFQ